MSSIENRKNQRVPSRPFSIVLILDEDLQLSGRALTPSAFGANVEINQHDYELLEARCPPQNLPLVVRVRTDVNELPAQINSYKSDGERRKLSVKLLDDRNWYSIF